MNVSHFSDHASAGIALLKDTRVLFAPALKIHFQKFVMVFLGPFLQENSNISNLKWFGNTGGEKEQ